MLTLIWMRGLLERRTVRVVGVALCLALSVALVASLGAFITAANAGMTARAVAGVPVDWQVELAPGTDAVAGLRTITAQPGVRRAMATGYGDLTALVATTGPTVQTTGAGRVLGLPAGYAAAFPGEVRYLAGSHRGVLLAQQTAANLHVSVGDPFTLRLSDGSERALRVDGVIDLPASDSLFQVVGAPPGAGATAPPDNIVVLPIEMWRELFGAQPGLFPSARTQIHVSLSHDLPGDPAAAYTAVVERAHNLEAKSVGGAKVGNNLAAMLDSARADAVYSELLFLFLGLPGVVLGAMLGLVAGASGRDRRRREQALLRVRGAQPRGVATLALGEALVVGAIATVLGLAGAVVAGRLAFGLPLSAVLHGAPLAWAGVSAALGFGLAIAATAVPAWRDARMLTVRASSALTRRDPRPIWERLYLDLLLLAGAGLIYWQSMQDAYKVVLVPEGVPTISINYLTLLAPLMLWVGLALLAWRLSDVLLRLGKRVVAVLVRPLAGRLAGTVSSSMSRQRALLSRGLVLIALSVSFAVSVAVFNTTYMSQATVDAQLTNGSDVTVFAGPAGLPAGLRAKTLATPGVAAAQPMQHRLAYVGNDLQDLFGIDPSRIGEATPMSDAYFQSGTAREVLARLAATPDGILVSDETVKDFQLHVGDTLRLRMQGPDHAYHPVPFHYVGVAREFPTAPRDSFLIANASYVAKATGVGTYETLLVRTSAQPSAVAAKVRALLGPAGGSTVHDLQAELKTTLSGLTAVDLSGLTRLELVFAVIMVLASSGLMLMLGFSERKRSFAIAHALGAKPRQLASFVWSEAVFTALGGAVLGALGGWLEALVIVKILTGVFDPPPEALTVPWTYLGLVAAIAAISVGAAAAWAVGAARRPALEVLRDL